MTTLQDPPVVVARAVEPEADQPRRLSARTTDDIASLIGSFVGSLSLVWVAYEQVLAFSGVVGFTVAWWLVFVLMYMGVTALSNPWPAVKDRAAATIVASGALIVASVLVWVILYTFIRGWPALHHSNFFTESISGTRFTAPLDHGGVLFAIVGTMEQVAIATAISLPLGVATAIYLSEVGGRAAKVVRTVVEAMTALPDILAGLFVLAFLILYLHWQKDGIAVAIALSVTMTPIVARSAEVVLRVVPHGLREASWALGASTWGTVWRVVLPTARAGLATSLILGVARVAGETAPLLIVDQATTFFNGKPYDKPQSSLPLFIYGSKVSGETNYVTRGFAAASLLLGLVLILFILARFISRDRKPGRGSRLSFANRSPRPPKADALAPFPAPAPGEVATADEEPPDPPHWDLPDVTSPFEPVPPASMEPVSEPTATVEPFEPLQQRPPMEPYAPPPPYTPPPPYAPPPPPPYTSNAFQPNTPPADPWRQQ